MVSRLGLFGERMVLYIGLPAFAIIAVTMVLFAVFNAMFTIPTWGYYVTGLFVAAVVIGAAFATIVAYVGAWIGGPGP